MSEKEKAILNERELALLQTRKKNCGICGRKFYVLLLSSLISVIAVAVLLILQIKVWSTEDGSTLPIVILAAVEAVMGIVFSVELFSLGKFHEEFRMAGFAYVLATIAQVFTTIMLGTVGNIFLVITAILNIAFVTYFCSAMDGVLENVDSYLGESWLSYKKAYTFVTFALIICTLCPLFVLLTGVTVILSVLFDIVAICIRIWELYLLFASGAAMTEYSRKDLDPKESREASAA